MSEGKTIKISKETYIKLSEVAGELQMRLKRPVSLDEAMRYLLSLKSRGKGARITDLAGSWDLSDEEWAAIRTSLAEAWKNGNFGRPCHNRHRRFSGCAQGLGESHQIRGWVRK